MPIKRKGFTLVEILLITVLITVLAAAAIPAYLHYARRAKLQNAHSALLENAHFMERFYQQHRSFKQTSTTWPQLPITQTDTFCIRLQGQAKGAREGKFTLKAVAFDKNREPRVLKINESLITTVCETSLSTCSDDNGYFAGNTDKKCTVYQ